MKKDSIYGWRFIKPCNLIVPINIIYIIAQIVNTFL